VLVERWDVGQTILVVEDEPCVLMATSEGLRQYGFDVVEAINADEAVELLDRDQAISLVFSDVRMPGRMDGFQLARWTAERRPQVKVLITSGDVGTGEPPPGFDWSRNFVRKPYRVADVVEIIRSAMDR
jgi:CheY-like chemotaxis protein